jgi:hypothetical protein
LRAGGSATPFALDLGRNAVCPGDSASGNFRLQSFMVPASVDPAGLTFGANGPAPVGDQFRQPLFAVDSSPYVNGLTDVAVPPATTGGISGLPAFDFRVFSPGDVPAGDYRIGIACTLGPAGPGQVRASWSTTITVTTSGADRPAGLAWAAGETASPRPRPATGPEIRPEGGGGPPTTTRPGRRATTTTAPDGESPTTTALEVAFAGSDTSDPSVSETIGRLPLTGSSPAHLVAWGVALLLVGRMVYLMVRRPKVLPPAGE